MLQIKKPVKAHAKKNKIKNKNLTPNDASLMHHQHDADVVATNVPIATTDDEAEKILVVEVREGEDDQSGYSVVADARGEVMSDASADDAPELSSVSSATTSGSALSTGAGTLANTSMLAMLGGGGLAAAAVAGAGGGSISAGAAYPIGGYPVVPVVLAPVVGDVFAALTAADTTPATPVVSADTIGHTDFGGNVSSIVSTGIPAATGAIGSSGKALKVEQTVGNEGWSGVTFATLAAGAEFINTANKTMSVKVWSPASGLKVRLKLEDAADATKTIETEATTTVANGWQTLTFDFNTVAAGSSAFNDANTYNKADIFLDFLVGATKTVARTFYVDDISYNRVTASGATATTITFDEIAATPVVSADTIGRIDFGGVVSSLVSTGVPVATGAIGSTGKALKIDEASGNEGWAGTTFATLANGAEFINTANKTMSVKVWSPASGLKVRLKLEDATDSTKSVESETTTTVANGWQTLTFDFNTVVAGSSAFNDANIYNKADIFLDFLVGATKTATRTFYVDDISYNRVTASGATATTITFDETVATIPTLADHAPQFLTFNGMNVLLDSTTQVFKVTKLANPNPVSFSTDYGKYSGFQISTKVNASGSPDPSVKPIPFATGTTLGMWVHSNKAGTVVRLQVDSTLVATDTPVVEADAVTTQAGWQFLTFDFSKPIGDKLASNVVYNQVTVLFDPGAVKLSDTTYYFDKLVFGNTPLAKPADIPFTAVTTPTPPAANLVFADEFSGTGAPDSSKWELQTGAGGWGNNEIQTYTNSLDNAFVQDGYLHIVAKMTNGTITSARLLSKMEVQATGYAEVRAKIPTDVGAWPAIWLLGQPSSEWPARGEIDMVEYTTRYWTDGNQVQAALHFKGDGDVGVTNGDTQFKTISRVAGLSNDWHVYQLWWHPDYIRIGVDGDQNSAYFYYRTSSDLKPVDFGGAVSSITLSTDTLPSGADGKAVKWIKSASAEAGAGSTLSTLVGAEFIDATHQTVSVRVNSLTAGNIVKLKLENSDNSAQFVEKDLTTVAGWQTLTFDFSTPSTGTLNHANTYNKASIFLDYGVVETATKTFYIDDFSFFRSGVNAGQVTMDYDEFSDPAKFILNVAMGGSLGADSNLLATKNYEMLVDYVHYYNVLP